MKFIFIRHILIALFSIIISLAIFYFVFHFFGSIFFTLQDNEESEKKEIVSICSDNIYFFSEKSRKCFDNPFLFIEGRPPLQSEMKGVNIEIKELTSVSDELCSCALSTSGSFEETEYINYFHYKDKTYKINKWLCFDYSSTKKCIS